MVVQWLRLARQFATPQYLGVLCINSLDCAQYKTSFKDTMIQQIFNLMLLGVVEGGASSSGGGLGVCPRAFLEVPCLSFQYMQQRLGALQNLREEQEQRTLQ